MIVSLFFCLLCNRVGKIALMAFASIQICLAFALIAAIPIHIPIVLLAMAVIVFVVCATDSNETLGWVVVCFKSTKGSLNYK